MAVEPSSVIGRLSRLARAGQVFSAAVGCSNQKRAGWLLAHLNALRRRRVRELTHMGQQAARNKQCFSEESRPVKCFAGLFGH